MKKLILTIAPMTLLAMANAQSNNTVVNKLDTVKEKVSLSASSSLESSLEKGAGNSFQNTTSLSGKYKLDGGYVLSTGVAFDKDFNNDRELTVRDSSLSVSKSIGASQTFIYRSLKASLTLPISKRSRKDTDLITALSLGATYGLSLDKYMSGVSLYLMPSITKYAHQYETARYSLTSNSSHRALTRVLVSYDFAKRFNLSMDNIYYRTWTYRGNSTDVFVLDQSLSYQVSKELSASLGHSLGGNALDFDGKSSAVRLFDENESTVYTNLTYRY
ncbi:hypothetical protein HBN50_06365 [Halobacteriovorax sp. GB3]|uniref:hypothetical protein n=1 Tax=Halobacteriovorax sp. GB3 TaxID=2719615 RepID=UPI00235EFC4A|nr:hypothetical protein [Halobacteriovorax sp. GB3]MDD0852711.1 hypothetical protein [Halobacteriovorax sp. GB3]